MNELSGSPGGCNVHPLTKNLTGKIFGRLTVQRYLGGSRHGAMWECACRCGRRVSVIGHNLLRGNSRSCGCPRAKNLRVRHTTHGESRTRLYNLWSSMKGRCLYPCQATRKYYFDRQVQICSVWKRSYVAFRDWALEHGYREGLFLDRIDNARGYEPDNCRFVSSIESANNKTNNRVMTAFGEAKTVAQWARDVRCRVGYKTLSVRLWRGWVLTRALLTPRYGVT